MKITKKFLTAVCIALAFISLPASAQCFKKQVHSSGAYLFAGDSHRVYGPYTISCLALNEFKFEDLTGHRPEAALRHIIEKEVNGQWQVVSTTTSYGAARVNRSFMPTSVGVYQYRIENLGPARVRSWKMKGVISL